MRALVVFGSKSDSNTYLSICKVLKKNKIEYDLRICSAHRTPKMLNKILRKNYSLVIAGAGLAAHLPGVAASKTIRPVIGVPCEGNFSGLDALLSIIQMPPSVPVISVGVNSKETNNLGFLFREFEGVNLIGKKGKAMEKCIGMLDKFRIKHESGKKTSKNNININFVDLEKGKPLSKAINVAIKEKSTATDSLKLLNLTKKGFWVGLNRGENAAIAAVEIPSMSKRYDKELKKFRKEIKQKVIKDDMGVK